MEIIAILGLLLVTIILVLVGILIFHKPEVKNTEPTEGIGGMYAQMYKKLNKKL